jgi:hypothetical protein
MYITQSANITAGGSPVSVLPSPNAAGTSVSSGARTLTSPVPNKAEFVNLYDVPSPTGLVLTYLPYLGLVVVALGALAALVVVKSRKRAAVTVS